MSLPSIHSTFFLKKEAMPLIPCIAYWYDFWKLTNCSTKSLIPSELLAFSNLFGFFFLQQRLYYKWKQLCVISFLLLFPFEVPHGNCHLYLQIHHLHHYLAHMHQLQFQLSLQRFCLSQKWWQSHQSIERVCSLIL